MPRQGESTYFKAYRIVQYFARFGCNTLFYAFLTLFKGNPVQDTVPADSTLFTIYSQMQRWFFYRPSDPDHILNRITDEEYERDQFLPFWAEHWPSSEVLLSYCINNLPPDSRTICELGCGLGIISAALATTGRSILATDIAPQACVYSSANMRKYSGKGNILCCDWRHPPFKQTFDCIIASDILYEQRWIEPIVLFLQNHLASAGSALIADPTRQHWVDFKSRIRSSGFVIETVKRKKVNDGKTLVEILKIQKENLD